MGRVKYDENGNPLKQEQFEMITVDDFDFRSDELEDETKLVANNKKPLFVGGNPSVYDVNQSSNLACFLLANVRSLVRSNPDFIKNLIKDNGDGTVTVNLYAKDTKDGKKKLLPIKVTKLSSKKIDGNAADWVRYVEKAVAASGLTRSNGEIPSDTIDANGTFAGNNISIYSELDGGDPQIAMSFIVPGNIKPSMSRHNEIVDATDEKAARDSFEKTLRDAFANKLAVTAKLISTGHAVSIGGVVEKNGKTMVIVDDQLNGEKYVPIEDLFEGKSDVRELGIYPVSGDGTNDIESQFINTYSLFKDFQRVQSKKQLGQNNTKKEDSKPEEKQEEQKFEQKPEEKQEEQKFEQKPEEKIEEENPEEKQEEQELEQKPEEKIEEENPEEKHEETKTEQKQEAEGESEHHEANHEESQVEEILDAATEETVTVIPDSEPEEMPEISQAPKIKKNIAITPVRDIDYSQRSKDSYSMRLEEAIENCNQTLIAENGIPEELQQNVILIERYLKKIQEGPSFEYGDGKKFRKIVNAALKNIDAFNKRVKEGLNIDSQTKLTLDDLTKQLSDPNGVIAETQRGFDINDSIHEDLYLNDELSESKYYKKPMFSKGDNPSIEALRTIDLYTSDPVEVTNVLLWGATSMELGEKLYGEKFASIEPTYQRKAYEGLCVQLDEAPFDVQMEYLKHITAMDKSLRENAYKVYENAYNTAPNGANKEVYAAKVLSESQEYISCMGAQYLKEHLNERFYEANHSFILSGVEGPIDKNLANGKTKLIGGFISGDLDKILLENNLKHSAKDLTDAQKLEYPQIIESSGMINENVLSNMADDYEALMKDNQKASFSFTYMQDSIKAVMSFDGYSDRSREKLNHFLENAIKASDDYLKSHSGHHFTENGKKRFELANKFKESLSEVYARVKTDPQKTVQNKIDLAASVRGDKVVTAAEARAAFNDTYDKFLKGKATQSHVARSAAFFVAAKKGMTMSDVYTKLGNQTKLEDAFKKINQEDMAGLLLGKPKAIDKLSAIYDETILKPYQNELGKDNKQPIKTNQKGL